MRQRRSRTHGFTLPELLTVVAITGVMAALAMFSMSGAGNEQNSAALARGLQFAMLRARTEALSDGTARQLRCTTAVNNGGCSYWVAPAKGMLPSATLSTWTDGGNNVQASSHAWLWNISSSADTAANKAGAVQMSSTVNITFYPNGVVTTGANGTSTGATVYVADKTGQHKFKVLVFGGTGLSKLVSTW